MRENLISSQGKTAKVCYVNFRDTFTTLKKYIVMLLFQEITRKPIPLFQRLLSQLVYLTQHTL